MGKSVGFLFWRYVFIAKAYFTTREIADSIGEQVGTVRSVAFRLFDRNEIEVKDNEFCFTVEQTEKIESVFKKESQKENKVLVSASSDVPVLLSQKDESESDSWYTLEQLSSLTGFGKDRLNQLLPELCNQLQNSFKMGGYHNTQKFYSENVLKALKDYQIKNGVSNAMKNKSQVQENIVKEVSKLTYEATVEQIKQEITEQYSMLSEATREMIARDIKINMQSKYIEKTKLKAEYYDKICDATNLTEIGTVGKNLGIGDKKFFDVLRNDKIIYRKCDSDGVTYYVAYYGYEKYFSTIQRPFEKDGKNLVRNKLMFNQQGVVWANRRYRMERE